MPFDGFISTFGLSSGFTTDFPATESTVIFSVSTSLAVGFTKCTVDGHVAYCDCVQVHLVRPPLSIIGVVARAVFSFSGDVILWRFDWQTLVHPPLLAHRTDRKVHREATFHIGFRLRCVSCSRIHMLQSVELFLLPITTIMEWILFVSVVFIAGCPKLPAKRFCPLEPGIRWQWWNHFCGFICGFITIPQRTPNRWSQWHIFVRSLFLRPRSLQNFSLLAQIFGAPHSLRSSSPASALRALRRRSPLPNVTKFSISGRYSFRTGRASTSSAPPAGRVTNHARLRLPLLLSLNKGREACADVTKNQRLGSHPKTMGSRVLLTLRRLPCAVQSHLQQTTSRMHSQDLPKDTSASVRSQLIARWRLQRVHDLFVQWRATVGSAFSQCTVEPVHDAQGPS